MTQEGFDSAIKELKHDTSHHSNLFFVHNHPAYKEIIAGGLDVLPMIFKELSTKGGDLFRAVQMILINAGYSVDEIPRIPEESRGKIKEMTQIYIDWAFKKGF